MTTVLGYINTGSASAAAATGAIPGAWCRPQHKPTCCVYITGGNSCCVCVPTSATCFIIEMWSQGGGGAGGCCCGVGSYGGQGGTYGWVTCTTSATNQILCACACICICMNCDTICTGSPGHCSRVTQCNSPSNTWILCGGNAGSWCCNPGTPAPWCYQGSLVAGAGNQGKYNTYLIWRCNSAQLAGTAIATNTSGSGLFLQGCSSQSFTQSAVSYTGCCSCTPPVTTFTTLDTTQLWGCLCTCSTFSSPYVWKGACGWSDVSTTSTPYASINGASAQTGIPNAACGYGIGVGGAAYAGGNQAFFSDGIGVCYASNCWVQNGSFPGGGGMSAWTQTAQGSGSCGGLGLILISWC